MKWFELCNGTKHYHLMEIKRLSLIDIQQELKGTDPSYANLPLTLINDHVIRVSVMTESFYWHLHPNSDESFLVVEGSLFIDLENTTVELTQGQIFTVPKNIKHRTRPNGGRSVNLTFERENTETIKLNE
jgi:mannose-6-phosphate isomerase-like protein (cupin superfamily)